MESFETFNFDILVIIIFIAGLVFGFYYGFSRQLKKTINLMLPFIILHFLMSYIISFLLKIEFVVEAKIAIFAWLRKYFLFANYENSVFTIFIGIILYLILYLVIAGILKIFNSNKEKTIFKQIKGTSRILGGVVSLFSSYIYSMLFLFVFGATMMIDISRPVSDLLSKTSNGLFDISELHLYQNEKVYQYDELNKAFSSINGETAQEEYLKLRTLANEFTVMNEYFKNTLLPNVSETSRGRIIEASPNDNYVLGMMQMGERKTLFHYILLDETDNSLYKEFNEKYEYLLENRGYVYFFYEILENDFEEYTIEQIFTNLRDKKDQITTYFLSENSIFNFNNTYKELEFYCDNSDDLYRLINSETTSYMIEEYVSSFSECFKSLIEINDFKEKFLLFYDKDAFKVMTEMEKDIFTVVKEAFLTHDKNIDLINEMAYNLSYEAKITLVSDYKDFFQSHVWEDKILVNSFINDSLSFSEATGHDLYFEYMVYEYLLKSEDDQKINLDDIIDGLTRLNDLANLGIITDDAKYQTLENVFLKDTGLIFSLQEEGLLEVGLLDEINASPRIDSEIKIYLNN
ncbi:MAG: CvpA family protein [Bacilli bacterium]|nr:CvpA family protein [Bacilli bacterium]